MILVSVVSLYFFFMAVAAVYSSAHIRALNESGYARTTVLLCFAVCFYIIGYAMELNSAGIPQILFWNRVEYIGVPFVSALWLTVGLMDTGHYARHKKLWLAAIYIVPLVTLVLRYTNGYHHLYFASLSFVTESGTLRMVKEPGPWAYVQAGHSMMMILVTLGLFLHDSFQTEENARGKISLITGASFFAVAGLVLSLLKPLGMHLDYMALCLPVTCVMVILTIQRYDFLETKSIARSRVFESGRDAILLMNRQNKIIDYNTSAKTLFQKLDVSLAGKQNSVLFRRHPKLLESLLNQETRLVKIRINGEKRYYKISTKNIDDRSGTRGKIKTIRDVTETYKLNENLKRQAMMDELSGLSNRRAFIHIGQKRMLESEEKGVPVHLLMMDLDYFKNVNDRYGHPTGDRVIQSFGEILKGTFPRGNLISRVGGEEFAALLAGLDDEDVWNDVETVRRSMERYAFRCQGETFFVTVSIGVAKKSLSGQTLDKLMRMADQALYQSKERGRNCATVYEGLVSVKHGSWKKGSDRR